MDSSQRRILKVAAYLGWGATVAIFVGIAFEAAIIIDKSFLFGRLFALLGLVSSVITLGLWNEAARARHAIPVEEAWKVGAAYGANYVRRMALVSKQQQTASMAGMPQPGEVDWDAFWQTPVNQSGQQDSPPIKWPPRR